MTSQTGGLGFLFPGPPFPLPYGQMADGYGISFNSGLFGFCTGATQTLSPSALSLGGFR